ncbi:MULTISPECIES: lytic polysaccharide monooxygenase [Streptomyces]|uniref:lytic polysaccharide monooxygenase n=1 Tax=Streptomyces TaxID=1883 RepID=UPI00017E929F|nr:MULTISPECIES: lytic polysaccharide monooxygenase [Streptomyces]AKL65510.1 chitin-binding protein [Streptomyces sp. Mg1]EDX27114.1 cellulose-binding protein [Streptomyces sp. Mg1]OKI37718.1 chitin-binding protein [Streptomyces sp. CB03578]RPK37449.1 GlcNAc-binding protein A precursor [Streptomyces sp. ADI91-18]WBY19501.1 lytic polysaccharide monooxygenase [Streptomyces goshikiensis]
MPARRTVTRIAAVGLAPLAVAAYAAVPAVAHGSMTDPVSRVAACYAEGPESPKSAACKEAVKASGAQAFYDWNAVNIANAAGKHKALIPDGKLCSAGNDKYRGLDLARGDWPSSPMKAGEHTFRYKGTAPHKGSFELYVTKDGYDPSKPLKWSDLEPAPFAKVTDPGMQNGDYVFKGTVPKKSGRHLIYSIWQRSDSPEAFYTCSDVVFGKDSGGTGSGGVVAPSAKPSAKASAAPSAEASAAPTAEAPTAKAPTEQQIAAGTGKSSVEHGGHGDNDPKTNGESAPSPLAEAPSEAPARSGNLAETGGSGVTPMIAIAGAGTLGVGAIVLFGLARRRATTTGRGGR